VNRKVLILDLDETLIDTKPLKDFRNKRQWSECYSNTYLTSLYPSGDSFIQMVSEQNIEIAIVTNSPRKYAQTIIEHHRIPVSYLVAYHDTTRRKPHPDPILKCMDYFDDDNIEFIGIGDDVRDILAYRAAGIKSIAVTWGIHGETDFIDGKPNFLANSYEELIGIINSWGQSKCS
jgi:HAD superfamily hydrolase (TIGR01662 family)